MKWYEAYYLALSAVLSGTGVTMAICWHKTYPLSAWIGGGMSIALSICTLLDLRAFKRRYNLP